MLYRGTQFGKEWKFINLSYKDSYRTTLFEFVRSTVDKFKESFEHTGCGTGCRDKFADFASMFKIFFPAFKCCVNLLVVETENSGTYACGITDFKIWETGHETLKLRFNLSLTYSFVFQEFKIFGS